MSETELILRDDTRLELPPARNDGAVQLWKRAGRLPDYLPAGVNVKQFVMAVAAEVNGLPAECSAKSVVTCAFNCAVLGLLPGQFLGHAHFIPFKNTAQLVLGYKGLLTLAYQTGFLAGLQCDVVLRGEEYDRWNDETGPRLNHKIPLGRDEKYTNVEAAYCVWQSRAGGRGVEVVSRDKLDGLRKSASSRSPWHDRDDGVVLEMCLKTPLRRAAKRWQITGDLGKAVTLDDLAEVGKPQPQLPGPDGKTIDDEFAEPTPGLDAFGSSDPLVAQGAETVAMETAATEAATEEEEAEQTTLDGTLFNKSNHPG